MVFPHRACGFAAGAAPIPVYRWDFIESLKPRQRWRQRNKDAAGGTPAAPAALADWGSDVVEDQVQASFQLFFGDAPVGGEADAAWT